MNDQTISVLAAVGADMLLGEPRMWHPLVGFGNVASKIDSFLFKKQWLDRSSIFQRLVGVVAVVCVVALPVMAISVLAKLSPLLFGITFLYLSIGFKSLKEHADSVADAVEQDDLLEARKRVGYIVSRNTDEMSPVDIARAAIESVLENGCDAVFGALFWFVVLGPSGAVLFRLSNTLDAMWGYKTEKYLHFGWAAARLDDLLCFIPARLTALTYAVCGDFRCAITCWRHQARRWYSPNAGPVMSSGAGALALRLGGAAKYHGVLKERPVLGAGSDPQASDIRRAVRLVGRGVLVWILLIAIEGLIVFAKSF